MEENMQMREAMAKAHFTHLGGALLALTIGMVVGQIILGTVVAVMASMGMEVAQAAWMNWLMSFLPLYGVGFPLAMMVLKKLPTTKGTPITLGAGRFIPLLLMCYPVLYAGSVVGNMMSSVLSQGQAENALVGMVSDITIWKALLVAVVAPVGEEFLFRKQLIDRCVQYGEKTAIVFSGLTFALFHMNLFQFFYAFGLGVLFAYVYVRTRSLRYPIIMHMAVNFTGSVLAPWVMSRVDWVALEQLNLQAMDESLLAQLLPDLMLYMGYILLYLGLVVVGLVLLLAYRKKLLFKPAPEELPRESRLRVVYGNVGMIAFVVLCLLFLVIGLLPLA